MAMIYDRFSYPRTPHRSGAVAQGQAAGYAQPERPACGRRSTSRSPNSIPDLLWNQATIGVVAISHSRDYLDGLMKNVERAATRIANNAGAEVTDSFVEFL